MPVVALRIAPLADRIKNLEALLAKLGPCPPAWLEAVRRAKKRRSGGRADGMECLECSNYKELISAWRKAMRWTDGLDCALSVMLAVVASTKSVGEQLWCKIISPPSTGKSTLIEGISVNSKYVIAKSTIRGFHSGYGDKNSEDNSLLVQAMNKTLATKDGDTLLKSPNMTQILSEARDIYDGCSRTHYRNSKSNEYTGIRMTWILCGTSALREIDASELGARFLDCVIMDEIDEDLEDDIGWRVANRAQRNMCKESNGLAETQYNVDQALAMQLTGGYVGYLREHATELLAGISCDPDTLRRITRLGKFVAYMRARPSKTQDEQTEREFSPRLIEQHVRLANCLAVVLNHRSVNADVMRRVTKVALDTSRGLTLQIVEHLARVTEGLEARALALYTSHTEEKTRNMLRFLKHIGVVEPNLVPAKTGAKTNLRLWQLTGRMRKLYAEIERS